MKKLFIISASLFLVSGCSNNKDATDQTVKDSSTTQTVEETKSENIKQVSPVFSNPDAMVAAHIKEVFDHYIHTKTALVNSDSLEAEKGAAALLNVLKKFDRSLLPADQKEVYDKAIGSLKSSASEITNAKTLEQQREHFDLMSNSAYDLARSFGAGRPLYHDHCPMAFDNKGAMWLSEGKEISNPYFGDKMMNCGTVEEIIENRAR